jgi:hypothetical protein
MLLLLYTAVIYWLVGILDHCLLEYYHTDVFGNARCLVIPRVFVVLIRGILFQMQ